ncbi:MAG: hypothetical protein ACK41T_04395 [Pseudobdellovibrio sp.]
MKHMIAIIIALIGTNVKAISAGIDVTSLPKHKISLLQETSTVAADTGLKQAVILNPDKEVYIKHYTNSIGFIFRENNKKFYSEIKVEFNFEPPHPALAEKNLPQYIMQLELYYLLQAKGKTILLNSLERYDTLLLNKETHIGFSSADYSIDKLMAFTPNGEMINFAEGVSKALEPAALEIAKQKLAYMYPEKSGAKSSQYNGTEIGFITGSTSLLCRNLF